MAAQSVCTKQVMPLFLFDFAQCNYVCVCQHAALFCLISYEIDDCLVLAVVLASVGKVLTSTGFCEKVIHYFYDCIDYQFLLECHVFYYYLC